MWELILFFGEWVCMDSVKVVCEYENILRESSGVGVAGVGVGVAGVGDGGGDSHGPYTCTGDDHGTSISDTSEIVMDITSTSDVYGSVCHDGGGGVGVGVGVAGVSGGGSITHIHHISHDNRNTTTNTSVYSHHIDIPVHTEQSLTFLGTVLVLLLMLLLVLTHLTTINTVLHYATFTTPLV